MRLAVTCALASAIALGCTPSAPSSQAPELADASPASSDAAPRDANAGREDGGTSTSDGLTDAGSNDAAAPDARPGSPDAASQAVTIDAVRFAGGTDTSTVDPALTPRVRVLVDGTNLPLDGANIVLTDDLSALQPEFRAGASDASRVVLRLTLTDLVDGRYQFRVQISAALSSPLTLTVRRAAGVCGGDQDCDDGLACTQDRCNLMDGTCSSSGDCLDAADEDAAYRLLKSARRVQLQRPRADQVAARWLVVGPASQLLPGSGHLIDPQTGGVGDTLADAVSDYETKHALSFGAGGSLDADESALLYWYGEIPTNGPTALRRDNQGGYHGEFYRQATGVQHQGPFPTLAEALGYLRAQGL